MMHNQNKMETKNNLFVEQNFIHDAIDEEDVESGENWLIQKPRSKKYSQDSNSSIGLVKPHLKKLLFDEQSDLETYSPGTLSTRSSLSTVSYWSKLLPEQSLPEQSLPAIDGDENNNPSLPGGLFRKNDKRKQSWNPSVFSLQMGKSLSEPIDELELSHKSPEMLRLSRGLSLQHNLLTKTSNIDIENPKEDTKFLPKLPFELIRSESRTPQPYSMDIESENLSVNSQCSNRSFFDSPDLKTGSFAPQCLPTILNMKNPSIATISASTLEELLTTNTNNHQFLIIDCRYDYEYEGGHIKDAINIFDPMILERLFITNKELLYRKSYIESLKQNFNFTINSFLTPKNYENEPRFDKPPIIIFHCEFSFERGPRMLSHLRNVDRDLNAHIYPQLDYPEVYLLAEGYKNFHIQSPKCCYPIGSYVEMKDDRFKKSFSEAYNRDRQYWNKKTGNVRRVSHKIRAFLEIFE